MPFDTTKAMAYGWAEHHRDLQDDTFPDLGKFTRPDPDAEPVFDPETGRTERPSKTVYEGPCSVEADPNRASEVNAAGELVTIRRYIIGTPWHVTAVAEDDRFELVESKDPILVGVGMRVRDVPAATFVTARRIIATSN